MTVRRWRRGAVAVLAVLCVLGPARPSEVRVASDLGRLPADRYEFTSRDFERLQRASALLVRQCMARRGHRDFPLDPRYPSDPIATSVVSTDYGVLDFEEARRWGYGWDPSEPLSAPPAGRRMTDAEFADFPACGTSADRRLLRGVEREGDWLFASSRAIETDRAVLRDPHLRTALEEWSRCMVDHGFPHYPDPVAAYSSDAWHRGGDGNTRHTRRERATAVADIRCKRHHRTAQALHTARARHQTADIARHRDGYADGLRALEAYRDNIAEVLRKEG
ncbi:hypothetical protein [Streptomyces sp. NPDC060194]|uniref:hypothetical protein n=1 Tax=Streptomyces sp. NPDC060194 TaxID=3347069 RepID=UPI00365A5EB9